MGEPLTPDPDAPLQEKPGEPEMQPIVDEPKGDPPPEDAPEE